MTSRIRELLGVEIPIVQAPMTYIAGAELAAAVSNSGGLGMIETASPQGRADLARVRDLTDNPVGANIALIAMKDPAVADLVLDLLVETQTAFVTTSAGDPGILTERLHEAGIRVCHVIGTLQAALRAVAAGVDGLVVEGVEGGGFKNAHGASTMVLLPLVASQVDIPLISAGGICDSRSMAASLVLGAEGVQMGTRMLASVESPVHENFKRAIVEANDTGTVLLSLPELPTMRVIRTENAERAASTGSPGGPWPGAIRDLYFGGDMQVSLANTGQVAGRIDTIQPVAEIVSEIWSGCHEALLDASRRAGRSLSQASLGVEDGMPR